MSLKDKLRSIFNRDIEYIDEYVETTQSYSEEDITLEEREVIALFVAAYAAEEKEESHFRVKSIKRVG